jgi:regulator of sigma E protease
LVFGFLVMAHEFGHFIMAKKFGVNVLEFAVGMGPVLLRKHWRGTDYSLRLLPLGGFCQMEGEDEETETVSEGSLNSKPVWQRIIIVSAGAIVNLLIGFCLLLCVYGANDLTGTTQVAEFRTDVTVTTQQSGLQVGDKIEKIGDTTIRVPDDISSFLNRNQEETVEVTVERDGQTVVLSDVAFPYQEIDKSEVTGSEQDAGQMMRVYYADFYVAAAPNSIGAVVKNAFYKSVNVATLIWSSLYDLVTGHVPVSDLAGPVGLATVISDAAQVGLQSLINIVVLITINLGIMNLLPLPALDGGRLVFLLVEAVIRRPVPPRYEAYVHFMGFVLLMLLAVFVTYQDILRILH